jgi:hypothetical protein
MEEIKNKKLEKLLVDAEKLDWSYTIYQEPEGNYGGWHCNERNYVELEKHSPAGEDFSMIIDFDMENPIDSFLENLKEYSDDFDIDEHVEMWIPERGKGGCPDSIRELVEDAEDIKEMIFELWDALCAEMTIPLF